MEFFSWLKMKRGLALLWGSSLVRQFRSFGFSILNLMQIAFTSIFLCVAHLSACWATKYPKKYEIIILRNRFIYVCPRSSARIDFMHGLFRVQKFEEFMGKNCEKKLQVNEHRNFNVGHSSSIVFCGEILVKSERSKSRGKNLKTNIRNLIFREKMFEDLRRVRNKRLLLLQTNRKRDKN